MADEQPEDNKETDPTGPVEHGGDEVVPVTEEEADAVKAAGAALAADEDPETVDAAAAGADSSASVDDVAGDEEVVPVSDEEAEAAAASGAAVVADDDPATVDAAAPAAGQPKGESSGPVTLEERIARREAERARKAAQRRRFRARAKVRRAEQRTAESVQVADHAPEHGPGRPKTRQGVVLSAKPDKTISVRIDLVKRHPRYHKIMRSSSTLHVHDERNDANEGDTVRVVECRPMSRSKRWRLVEVVERAR